MTPAIQMEDVVFRFLKEGQRNILDHVSLTIEAGRMTVIMGGSGCGKSTLAAVAAGLYPENGGYLEQGSISLFGHSLAEMDPARRAAWLTVMFQNPDLQFCMDTLRHEMQFCLENISVPVEEMDARISAAAELMHMTPMLDRPLTQLSGGEKQKSVLCCLYVMESRCILLDEPFANLDPDSAEEIAALLSGLKDRGCTIVAIDHRLDHWLPLLDEVILLGAGGKPLATGITPDALRDYRDLFREQGVFFPDDLQPVTRRRNEAGPAAVVLEHISIPVSLPKRRLFAPREEPVWLLKDASASFAAGQMTAILGPSGCGKTTTFLSILKQHPYEGSIRVDGQDIAGMKKAQLYRKVGIVFQNPANQFITQNIEEEVQASLRVWEPGLDTQTCTDQALRLLESYGLQKLRRYSPYMISQGQQRRLAVLSVLSGHQKILFLDEPTYGQDCRSTRSIMEQLRQKMEQEQLTIVFITHDRELATEWADRIYRLEDRTLKEVTV